MKDKKRKGGGGERNRERGRFDYRREVGNVMMEARGWSGLEKGI